MRKTVAGAVYIVFVFSVYGVVRLNVHNIFFDKAPCPTNDRVVGNRLPHDGLNVKPVWTKW